VNEGIDRPVDGTIAQKCQALMVGKGWGKDEARFDEKQLEEYNSSATGRNNSNALADDESLIKKLKDRQETEDDLFDITLGGTCATLVI